LTRSLWPVALGLWACTPETAPPADTDLAPAAFPVLATADCAPAQALTAPGAPLASLRTDVFLPYGPGIVGDDTPTSVFGTNQAPTYPEASLPDPVGGGRVQVALVAPRAGRLAHAQVVPPREGENPEREAARLAHGLHINGRPAHELLEAHDLFWYRVWPTTFEAGDPLWVSFHSRDAAWDTAAEVDIQLDLQDDAPLTFRAPLGDATLRLQAAQPDPGGQQLHLHVRNHDDVPHTLRHVEVNGVDVTDTVCLPDVPLAPGTSLWIPVPLDPLPEVGDAWTAVVHSDTTDPAVGVGRILPAFFPLHTWPQSSDCPLPGVNDDAFQAHREAGYDTFFSRTSYGSDRRPDCSDAYVPDLLPAFPPDAYVMVDEWFPLPDPVPAAVAARLLGDEVDNKSLETLVDGQKMRRIAETANFWMDQEPAVPTYIGGSRNRHNGMFAGAADLQGMDYYVDGCAPHVTDFGMHPPLRGAFDYLWVTKQNHAPNPTWLYTQGFSGAWNGVVPGPTGAIVQTWSAIAAGGKGLMTFQTSLSDAEQRPDTWQALSEINWSLEQLRDQLVLGDPTGWATTSSPAIVEALRVPQGVVLLVIGLQTTQGPDELACLVGNYTEWTLADHTVEVRLELPEQVGLTGWSEMQAGAVLASSDVPEPTRTGRTLTWQVPVSDAHPVRVLLLREDPQWLPAP